MSDLNFIERSRLELLFEMGGGYVLGFSNNSLQRFIAETSARDIYEARYGQSGGSKANRLRRFWELKPNHVVGKLLHELISIAEEGSALKGTADIVPECRRIADRLLQGAAVQELDAVGEALEEKDFELLVRLIRSSIESNEPEAALDRLHTFVTRFLRLICRRQGIEAPDDKPIHSLLGEYIKKLRSAGRIETQMTERILKSTVSTLEAFNTVRNDHSFAHDNSVLNYEESLLIFNHVTNAVRFIQSLERKPVPESIARDGRQDEIPF